MSYTMPTPTELVLTAKPSEVLKAVLKRFEERSDMIYCCVTAQEVLQDLIPGVNDELDALYKLEKEHGYSPEMALRRLTIYETLQKLSEPALRYLFEYCQYPNSKINFREVWFSGREQRIAALELAILDAVAEGN